MNIKNERVHELAREAARRTGTSQTGALEAALTLYLSTLDGVADVREREASRRAKSVRRLVTDLNAGLTDEDRTAMRAAMDAMYDEDGLPA